MKSSRSRAFLAAYRRLPADERRLARLAYQRFIVDPFHPGLQFKRVSRVAPIWAVRVGLNYRALGLRSGDTITWYWIGSHAEYDQLLRHR